LLVHESVFESIGYFETYFSGTMGDDLYWTVKAHRHYSIYCLQEPLYSYRTNPNSITNVLDNPRKLVMPAILSELLRQQAENGEDWLSRHDHSGLQDFEEKLTRDKKFMAEQYRIWSAKAIDKHQFAKARRLLAKALRLYPWSFANFRTLFYYLKQRRS